MGIDCYGKVVLEPSAGKGDIVSWLKANGAAEVIACEIEEPLRKILAGECRIVAPNFFEVKAEQVSHIHQIVMNPPFSIAASHILHAWKVAPEGCEIIALCNWETVAKDHYGASRELSAVIGNYGESINLGPCFRSAERTTNVEVGLVRLFKPMVNDGMDLEGFYLDADEEPNENGMLPYNEIRAIVNNYVAAVKCFDRVESLSKELRRYTCRQFSEDAPEFKYGDVLRFSVSHKDDGIVSKEGFARGMQMQCWQYIFNRVGIQKYVTKGVLQDINKFIESRKNYPFTMKNVYRMLEIIVGTAEETMNRAIVEAVDNYTRHTHENRYNVEGWKTNAGHLLNRKFITPWIAEAKYTRGLEIKWYGTNWETMLDLVKALCFVTGRKFDDIPDVRTASVERDEDGQLKTTERYPGSSSKDYVAYNQFEPNTWYDWGFFRFKVFKKGTGHFQFKSEDDWAMLNRAYAKIKGQVLPETTYKKAA